DRQRRRGVIRRPRTQDEPRATDGPFLDHDSVLINVPGHGFLLLQCLRETHYPAVTFPRRGRPGTRTGVRTSASVGSVSVDFQPSLLDLAADGVGDIGVGPLAGRVQRTELSRGAWVDVLPGWFEGADEVF